LRITYYQVVKTKAGFLKHLLDFNHKLIAGASKSLCSNEDTARSSAINFPALFNYKIKSRLLVIVVVVVILLIILTELILRLLV
jgi:hypothetical protein